MLNHIGIGLDLELWLVTLIIFNVLYALAHTFLNRKSISILLTLIRDDTILDGFFCWLCANVVCIFIAEFGKSQAVVLYEDSEINNKDGRTKKAIGLQQRGNSSSCQMCIDAKGDRLCFVGYIHLS